MPLATWLADASRMTGYPVVEVAGWQNRGHGAMSSFQGVVCHHTAGPKTGEYPSLAVVRDGRPGLSGPLAQLGLGRSGTVYVIASGLSYHAGVSAWAGFSSLNSTFIGIEAEDDGDGIWTSEQLDCYPRLAAALCYYMGRSASRVCGHKECALPLGRKPDPAGINMNAFRDTVAYMLGDPTNRIPRGEIDVALTQAEIDAIATAVWNKGIVNWWDDTVPASLILKTMEYRCYDAQEVRLASVQANQATQDGKLNSLLSGQTAAGAKLDALQTGQSDAATALDDISTLVQQILTTGIDPQAITAAVDAAIDASLDGLVVSSTITPAP
jgi:N-acetylmuramoyl-L-alanine amidase